MRENNISSIKDKGLFADELTMILRQGAQTMLKQAVEEEIAEFMAKHAGLVDTAGHPQVVRNGYLPERTIQTGLGDINVQVPKSRDRSKQGLCFRSQLLPPCLKRTKSIDELLPWLYLKGISTGDFTEALAALLGPQAKGLSASTICRLKEVWQDEFKAFQVSDLSTKHYVYFWADGIYLEARMEQRQCMLVLIGVDVTGKKELVALRAGFRESEISWLELLLDLKARGLVIGPKLSIGDGALGFWKAMTQSYGETKRQRCWVHKTANVLNKLPNKLQPAAKKSIHNIWMASTKKAANRAFDQFLQVYGDKYPKATECLNKDRDVLLTFYDFPAAHWMHIRTTNPIESVFATVRHRTDKTKGCLSIHTAEVMAYKLICSASSKWIRLKGSKHMAEIISGINFKDGIRSKRQAQTEHTGEITCAA